MKNSEVADSAPVEMRFIGEKIESAYAAFNANDNKAVTFLVEQIELDFKIAETRSLVNQLNDDLLDSREKISEAQLLLEDLKEQLQ